MKIIIVGCGVMGKGLARRLSPYHTIFLYDQDFEKAKKIQDEGHGVVLSQLEKPIPQSEMVILAVKPQNLEEIAPLIECQSPQQIILSILSGTLLTQLRHYFPIPKIIRMMPNLALIYGEAAIGLVPETPLDDTEKNFFFKFCEPLGKVYWLNEEKMNAFTALAGSGPAFIFSLIESMVEAGILMGFAAKESQEIVEQMILGSLELLKQSEKHPGELIWQIASPAGTTIAGLKKLEESGVRPGIMNTFLAACKRAQEFEVK